LYCTHRFLSLSRISVRVARITDIDGIIKFVPLNIIRQIKDTVSPTIEAI